MEILQSKIRESDQTVGMKEKLIDIVKDLDSCSIARRGTSLSPFGRAHCQFDGKDETYWFCNEYHSAHELKGLSKFGHFVPKNSRLAIKIQSIDAGTSFEYEQPDYTKRLRIHSVVLDNRSDLQNQTIAIAGDTILYQFRDIREFLTELQKNKEDIEEIEAKISELRQRNEDLKKQKDTAQERSKITKSIKELQKEYRILTLQQEDLKNITIYIRKQGEMRYSLIVDPIQTRIKSQNLFDGTTVIIDGGPGTGKSTTMIHRLAYLTDIYAIDEDEKNANPSYKLNRTQRKQLREAIEAQRDWMFFSPSQMLKEYLAEAMRKEGLQNTSQKVWNWKEYCRQILQVNYGLLGASDSKAPFKVSNISGTLFLQNSDIIEELIRFYLDQFRNIKANLPQIVEEEKVYAWTAIAKGISQKFEDSESFDIPRFVSLFNSLEYVYGSDCKKLLQDKDIEIAELTKEIRTLLEKKKEAKADIESLVELSSDSDETQEEEEPTGKNTEDKPTSKVMSWLRSITGSNKEKEDDLVQEDELSKSIQKWLKAFCYHKLNNSAEISDEQQIISEVLLPVLEDKYDSKIQKIGELLIFEQFAQYTKGVKAIMLSGLPKRYQKFRSHLIKTKYLGCDLKLLRNVMQRNQGKELHHQEQSLLLGFINTLVKYVKPYESTNIKHAYIDAYEEVARPIIGIDEATDFSACDIFAMQSLLTRDFNSLTLCGDMMQRLTTHGIKSWDELEGIVSNPTVVEMKTSYRQSKKLLEVARQLYTDTLEKIPNYKAFMKSSKVPVPLVFASENESDKIQWISKRIAEVYRAYGEKLPSIAIFVNDKGYIPKFIEILQKTEFFTKYEIKVLDGTNMNSKTSENHICIYPIEVVKGMEFDVVFFHNIDNASVDTELLKRYIYVGVSRAAFFLGITLIENKQEISKYFEKNKDWFKI